MDARWWRWLAEITQLIKGKTKPCTQVAWFPGKSISPPQSSLETSPRPPPKSISLPYPSIYVGTHKPACKLHQEVPASPQALAREECGLTLPAGALASRPWQKRLWLSQQETGRGSACPPSRVRDQEGAAHLLPLTLQTTHPPPGLGNPQPA